jgi:hypothetical protein
MHCSRFFLATVLCWNELNILIRTYSTSGYYILFSLHSKIVIGFFRFKIVQISWMEKFVQKGTQIIAPVPIGAPATTGMGGFERPTSKGEILRSDASAALNVGVLHLVPTLDVFPLLEDPKT